MSADFWASYSSGALGILIGNHLDVIKVQAQSGLRHPQPPTTLPSSSPGSASSPATQTATTARRLTSLFRGAAAPILGYGALNSILFMTYNRTLLYLDPGIFSYTKLAGVSLGHIFTAGVVGGVATWVVSAPSEYVKCRAQLLVDGQGSSYGVFRDTVRTYGVRGLYTGGMITSMRDGFGYGWYFWSYELMKRLLVGWRSHDPFADVRASEVLIAGGVAGVVTWLSIYPLDVVKTRIQTRSASLESEGLVSGKPVTRWKPSSMEVALDIWRESGLRGFYRGVGVCSLRAFIVNAVQWYAYEGVMSWLGPASSKPVVAIS
jgi:solute carrier family 25 (mitochondrial carnitine/acylcarnitine transporter), member 20/29